jgi:hypothetical protein
MRYRVFKRTNDDWYGTFILDGKCKLVEVVFSQTGPNPPINGEWIVYATGNDDYSIKKIFDSESEAWLAFTTILGWEFVDQQELLDIGFIYD